MVLGILNIQTCMNERMDDWISEQPQKEYYIIRGSIYSSW